MARKFTRHENAPPKYQGLSYRVKAEHVNELQIALEDDDVRIDQKADTSAVHGIVVDEVANSETVTDAAAAAVTSEIAGRDMLESHAIVEPDIAFAVVDEDGRRTWLEAGMDGKPTPHSRGIIGGSVEMAPGDNLAFAVVDEDGRRTWLEADDAGKPTERALSLISDGISTVGAPASAYIDSTGAIFPASSGPDIICWGDSMTQQGYPALLAPTTGHIVRNGGVGGEGSPSILARQGGDPYTVLPDGGSIPASGSVNITFAYRPGWPLLQGAGTDGGAWTGTLAGVHGTITLGKAGAQYEHDPGDVYTFTRTDAGSAVTVDRPVPFYSDFALARRADIAVFWVGRNDLWSSLNVNLTLAGVQGMVAYLSPLDKRFLVLSVCNGIDETTGTTNHNRVMEVNAALRRLYGRRFVDVRRYLIDYGLADAGITPTGQDTTDVAGDTVPASLRVDGVHLTSAGYEIVAARVAARLTELEWI